MSFILKQYNSFRYGQLLLRQHQPILTPTFVAPTSRGIIPHVTPDLLSKSTRIPAVYIGLEDFIEKSIPKAPILSSKRSIASARLRDYIALPSNCIAILGPRRIPAIECPNQNSNSSVAICTSVGFQALDVDDYVETCDKLDADIVVGVADIVTTAAISQKRAEKSADRTHAWTRDTIAQKNSNDGIVTSLFASIPPLEPEQQSFYLSDLGEDYSTAISGVTLYSADTAAHLPQSLRDFPRFCLTNPASPQEILRTISLGNDLVTVPFVTDTSENGVAMTFSLDDGTIATDQPLGFDLWDPMNATDVSALQDECQCYTCAKHHRAYIHHLLNAKEMLAWTLLQIHNFHVVEKFFESIRNSIADGSFETKSTTFGRLYSSEMPKASGEGPRVRGYQTKSIGGGESKKNKKAYGRLDEHALKTEEAESGIATPEDSANSEDLQKRGLGEVQ